MTRWPEKLIALIEVLEEQLCRLGVPDPEQEARAVAVAVLDRAIGGDNLYMPKSDRIKAFWRDEQIWSEWRGNNKDALARKHRVSTRHVEMVVARRAKAMQRERQLTML